jgi:acyl-CoA hydrolase
MPTMKRGPKLSLKDAQATVCIHSPLIEGPAERSDPVLDAIAQRVASVLPDAAAIQLGLGGAPGAVWAKLCNHRNLTIASGLVTEAAMLLAESGALKPDKPHRAGVAFGGTAFHKFLAEQDLVNFATVPETHGLQWLGSLDRFHAVNSALEVDLFGQVNLEWQNGRLVSGVGGAPDFARGAHRSGGGRSIIALPSTAKGGNVSRIVLRLETPTASLCGNEIDSVVTEHGIAHLRARTLDQRAEALIAIAAPHWRDPLAAQWSALRKTL